MHEEGQMKDEEEETELVDYSTGLLLYRSIQVCNCIPRLPLQLRLEDKGTSVIIVYTFRDTTCPSSSSSSSTINLQSENNQKIKDDKKVKRYKSISIKSPHRRRPPQPNI